MQVKVDQASLAEVYTVLAGVKSAVPRVIVRATNKTSVNVRQFMVVQVSEDYNLSQARIRKNMKINKANFGLLEGSIESKGRPINLGSYIGTRQTKKGVSAKVLKKGERHMLYHAYIWKRRTKAGKEAKTVMSRRWKDKAWSRSKKLFKKWGVSSKYGILPDKYRGINVGYRRGILNLTGPRVEDKLAQSNVNRKTIEFSGERWQVNIDNELKFELSKL